MLYDLIVVALIVIVAVLLGVTVHPWLFALLVLIAVWLVARHGGGRVV